MLKEKKALSILLTILLVGCLGVLAYMFYSEKVTEKVQDYVAPICTIEEIISIEYSDKEVITLKEDNGVWINSLMPNMLYKQEAVNEWINSLKSIETKQMIKNVQDEAIYGISEASKKITLFDAQGNKQKIWIGNVVESEDSLYIRLDENPTIYLISYKHTKALFENPNSLVDCSGVLEIPEIHSIVIEYQGEKIQLVKEDKWYAEDYFELESILDDEAMHAFVEILQNMRVKNYVGTFEKLNSYGLGSPSLVVTINGEQKIAFGKENGTLRYITLNDKQDVYTIEQSIYKAITDFRVYDAMNKQVIHFNKDEIKEIVLSNPQGTYRFNLELPEDYGKVDSLEEGVSELDSEKTDRDAALDSKEQAEIQITHEKAEESKKPNESLTQEIEDPLLEEVANKVISTINEVELNEEQTLEWLNKIEASIWIEAPLKNPTIEQKEERKAETTICYVLKNQTKVEIELIPYDINYYILRYNGVTEFAVNKERITKVFNELTNLVK